MKRLWQRLLCGLLPILGLIWVIGCGSSTSGGPTYFPYSMTLSVDPDTMSNGDDPAVVSCFLYREGEPEGGNSIAFTVASGDGAVITSLAFSTNADTGTGTVPTVYYAPDSVTAEWDTIFAVFMNAVGDVAASAYTVVRILP